jgi:Fe-S-cluster containining protein
MRPMTEHVRNEAPELPAGDFAAWLAGFRDALRTEHGSDVPCDGCTACCRSSQFVLVEPDERDTLAHIPNELLFPAPGRPAGHLVLGYDDDGCCPMLVEGGCSIYDHRPRACRTYDCRIFPAAGVVPREADKVLIAERVSRWRFDYAHDTDRQMHDAVRDAARAVQKEVGPIAGSTEVALRAITIHAEVHGDT